MSTKLISFFIIVVAMLPTKAFAYLDPGTGSIILQAILGFIAAAVASISIYWTKFKLFLKKIFKKKENLTDEDK
mgnify:CR=1 FL=1